ncbi:hypothetical protein ACG7TL_005678 [Trametes sanguinea]
MPQGDTSTAQGNPSLASTPSRTRKAGHPFDREDADLIIRSSDQVDFYVHRLVLSLASPVFATMFTLPQPPDRNPPQPVVEVREDSKTLDLFLRICYPVPDPSLESLDGLKALMTAALKYEASAVVVAVRRALDSGRRPVESDPLRVFAIACLFGLEEQAKAAAVTAAYKNLVVARSCVELDEISAGSYYRLLQLDRKRRSKMRSLFGLMDNSTAVGPFCAPPQIPIAAPRPLIASVAAPFDAPDAELILRSSDSKDFHVYQPIIALASPTFLQQVSLAPPPSQDQELDARHTVYQMSEDSAVIDALLRLCYPMNHDDQRQLPLDLLLDVLSAAHKYGMNTVEMLVRDILLRPPERSPLRLYFVAAQYQWAAEARVWASELLQSTSVPEIYELYCPCMETTPNAPYRHLLHYIEECSWVASQDLTISIDVLGQHPRPCAPARLPASNERTSCAHRYPTTISTAMPPSWLSPILAPIVTALKDRPRGSLLTVNGDVAKAFIGAVAADSPPCLRDSSPANQKRCSGADNVWWACTFLESYARAVDAAIAKVRCVYDFSRS